MEEMEIRQTIKEAYAEPRAPEQLIQSVILRAQAMRMGAQACSQLETAPAERQAELAAMGLIGQLAEVARLPEGASPEGLASQLSQDPGFLQALRGGHLAQRLKTGELMQQVANPEAALAEPEAPELKPPQIEGPML